MTFNHQSNNCCENCADWIFIEPKQELFSQFVLITIARFFERIATSDLDSDGTLSEDEPYYRHIFSLKNVKINFKNCLLVLGRNISAIMAFSVTQFLHAVLPKMIQSIQRVRYKIRPNRHFPRVSHRPISKWINNRQFNRANA